MKDETGNIKNDEHKIQIEKNHQQILHKNTLLLSNQRVNNKH